MVQFDSRFYYSTDIFAKKTPENFSDANVLGCGMALFNWWMIVLTEVFINYEQKAFSPVNFQLQKTLPSVSVNPTHFNRHPLQFCQYGVYTVEIILCSTFRKVEVCDHCLTWHTHNLFMMVWISYLPLRAKRCGITDSELQVVSV